MDADREHGDSGVMKTVDIILPVYNEEEVLDTFHASLTAELNTLRSRYRFNVCYVLDRSTDASIDVLRRLVCRDAAVTVLHLSRRFGHQMSLVAGIDQSRGDALIMMDCDLQHPPAIVRQLLEKFEEGYEVVHAIREYDNATPPLRRWSSRMFYRLQNALSPVEIRAGTADFRLISRRVARIFQNSIREQSQFLRGLFQWVGFRSATVTFVSPARKAGRTKYDVIRLVTFALTGMLSFSKVPLRFATLLGSCISTLSIMYGAWLIGRFFVAGYTPAGYTSLIVMTLFLGGLQLIVLGIIGEYVGSVFDEVKHRPLYIVDEVIRSPAPRDDPETLTLALPAEQL
jgi:glycosyltransferase involved in cell wall biosynthesis